MSYTKDEIIKEAFAELGLGAYSYSLQPEDKQTALRRLNAMLAEWLADGIDTGFTVTADPNADSVADDSGIADGYVRAVILNLAVEIAPNFGRPVMPDTMKGAIKGKAFVRRETAVVPSRVTNTSAVPAGAGHKYRTRITLVQE